MNPNDFLDKLSQEEEAKKLEQDKADQIGAVNQSGDKVVEALKGHTAELTGSIHDLLMATLVSKDPKIAETAKNLAGLLGEIKNATKDIKGSNFKPLADNLSQLQKTLTTVPKQIQDAHQATDPTPLLQEIAATLGKKNFNPNVSVKAPSVDLSPLTKILGDIKTAVSKETPDNSKLEDLTQSVASAVSEVKDAITSLRFPVANYVLPFQSAGGKDAQVVLDSDGSVPVAATFSGTLNSSPTFKDDPTDSLETPKYGKTNSSTHKQQIEAQLQNSSGTEIGTSVTPLQVSVANTGANATAVKVDGSAVTQPVSGTVTANAGTNLNTSLLAKSSDLTNGTQLAQIVDAGGDAVTVTGGKLDVNATISGSGGGSSAIDNTAFTAGSTDGTPIMGFYHSTIDTVTDGRTAALAMDSKRNLFGVIRDAAGNARGLNVDANGAIAVTATNATASNLKTAATLDAETTKVIGTVRNADGAGNLLTSNSTTYTAKFGQDSNLLGTLGTAFSTAGKVDIKGADGDIFVRQPTAANLNATVVGTGTFAVQAAATLNAETTKVIGTVNIASAQTLATVTTVGAVTSITNQVDTNLKQVAGANTLAGNGTSGTGAQRVTIASDSTGQVAPAAASTAIGTAIYNNTALSSTKQAVNASAGNLYGYHIYNSNSAVVYVQLFNLASASVTVGSTAPTAVLAVPAYGWADSTPGVPIAFGTALTIAATTTSTGSGTPGSSLLCNIWYK